MKISNVAKEAAYSAEKVKFQRAYEWTDEQFDFFWNNPEKNGYNKTNVLEFTQRVLDYTRVT